MADTVASTSAMTRSDAAVIDAPPMTAVTPSIRTAAVRTRSTSRGGWWPIPVLVVLCVPVFFWNLGNYGLVNGDEGFYHRIAENMVLSGDWLTVQWNGELRVYETFMNSPIHHWARAALIAIFGYNYWTMRIISATCGALAVIFTYKLAREFMTATESFVAAVFLMVSYQFVFLHGARTGELDALLTFMFVWLAYSFVRALRHNKSFIPHHLVLLALINIKLPIIIIPLVFEFAFLALTPRYWRHVQRWALTLICLCPFFIIWHAYQLFDLGAKPVFRVLNLMADQASGEKAQSSRHAGQGHLWRNISDNSGYYGRNLLYGGFPYIVFAPVALLGIWHRRTSLRTHDFLKVTVLAMFAVLGFFLVVSRRFPWYVIPAYPFAAILTARFLCRMERFGRGVFLTALFSVAAACAVLIKFRNNELNPFAGRAMNFSPKPNFREFLNLETWAAIAVLAIAAFVLVYGIRMLTRNSRWPLVPVLTVLTLMGFGGYQISQGLGYTTYFSHMEVYAQKLARMVERDRAPDFPIDVPLSGAQNLARYHFGNEYEIGAAGPGTDVHLVRRLRPDEKAFKSRQVLKANMSLSPLGVKTKSSKSQDQKKPQDKNAEMDESMPYTLNAPSLQWPNRTAPWLCLTPTPTNSKTGPLLW